MRWYGRHIGEEGSLNLGNVARAWKILLVLANGSVSRETPGLHSSSSLHSAPVPLCIALPRPHQLELCCVNHTVHNECIFWSGMEIVRLQNRNLY